MMFIVIGGRFTKSKKNSKRETVQIKNGTGVAIKRGNIRFWLVKIGT